MLNSRYFSCLFLALAMLFAAPVLAQDDAPAPTKRKKRPVRETFGSMWHIDQQTVDVPVQGTFTWDIIHRFGTWGNGYDDFFGIFAPSNIRLGFYYTPIKNLQIGFGWQKVNMLWDFNARYAIIRQSRRGGWPVSLTYYVNMGLDGRRSTAFPDDFDGINRLSYFHELIIARKITDWLSVQASVNLSHFNFQEQIPMEPSRPDSALMKMNNDHFAVSAGARFKISNSMGILVSGNIPITQHDINQPRGSFSIGLEVNTSSHAFQVFATNYYNISPQLNNVFNQNNPAQFAQYLLGFNMTRLWNF